MAGNGPMPNTTQAVPAPPPSMTQGAPPHPPPPPPPTDGGQVGPQFSTSDNGDVNMHHGHMHEGMVGVEDGDGSMQASQFNLDFAPLDGPDVLGFDFDAYLNTDDGGAGAVLNFDLNGSGGFGNPDGLEAGTGDV